MSGRFARIARISDSRESGANHPIRADRVNRFARITPLRALQSFLNTSFLALMNLFKADARAADLLSQGQRPHCHPEARSHFFRRHGHPLGMPLSPFAGLLGLRHEPSYCQRVVSKLPQWAKQEFFRKGRTWAIAVRRGSYKSLFLLNSGRFSLEK